MFKFDMVLFKKELAMELRPYQPVTIEAVRNSIRAGNKRIILQAPCGSGKTIMAAEIVRCALEKNKKVIFFVHYRQLAHQAIERFSAYGMTDEVGCIMAGVQPHLDRPVQVISIQTYDKRLQLAALAENEWFKKADLVFYDEAHSSIAKTRRAILELYKESAVILGLTATPCRSDGRPLNAIYQDIVSCSSISELTEEGFLVPVIYYGAKEQPNLEHIPETGGDYNQKVLGERVDKKKLVGDILENWLRIASDRQTVIFATNVKHSRHIEMVFQDHGIKIAHVDARTPDDKRQVILKDFEHKAIQVVTNCNVYSEGADMPWASCVVIAKPTKSYARFMQMGGRGLRLYDDKEDCILIDHARVVSAHGFLDDTVDWNLNGVDKAWKKTKTKKKETLPIECEECRNIFKGGTCPRCGWKIKRYGKAVKTTDAKLRQLTRKNVKRKKKRIYTMAEKRFFYGQLKLVCKEKNYKEGWIAHKYRHKFGVWPAQMQGVEPKASTLSFNNWMTYQRIKWARSRKKA
jgi:superfamily II DNA or RNA helicase